MKIKDLPVLSEPTIIQLDLDDIIKKEKLKEENEKKKLRELAEKYPDIESILISSMVNYERTYNKTKKM